MMQPQMPLGPPMGGGMGPPMGQPAPMPMGPMAGPMPGPQQVQGQQGVVGYGGSARGRAGFRDYMQRRKAESGGGMMYPQGSMVGMPALPPPSVSQLGMPQNAMISRQVSVGGFGGSSPVQVGPQPMMGQQPVQMMGGGAVMLREPLFGGLGRY